MGLFGPKWKSKNREKALRWVTETADSEQLGRAAREAELAEVRLAAIQKGNDQKVISEAALHDGSVSVRLEAVKLLNDQAVLRTVAAQDAYVEVRTAALRKITDETFLACYADRINRDSLAECALSQIKSQKGLALAAAVSGRAWIVKKCLDGLKRPPDEEIQAILRQSQTPEVQEFLIPYQSGAEREKIALTDTDASKRKKAISTLEDPDILYRIATEDSQKDCRVSAYRRLCRLRSSLPEAWWGAHITDGLTDQRLMLLSRHPEQDPKAAELIAKELIKGECGTVLDPYITVETVNALERMFTAGNTQAGKTLYRLYKSETLNSALSSHAAAQSTRFHREHADRKVDSDVCGELYRHDDYLRGETLLPL